MQSKPKHKGVSTCSPSGLRNLIGLGLYNFTSWFKHDRSNLYHNLRVKGYKISYFNFYQIFLAEFCHQIPVKITLDCKMKWSIELKNYCLKWQVMSHLFWCAEKKKRVRPNLVGLYNVKIMFYRYLYRILLVELLSEKSCKTYFFKLLFSFINLLFMIVKFCTYQFIEPHKFLNVGSREKIFL